VAQTHLLPALALVVSLGRDMKSRRAPADALLAELGTRLTLAGLLVALAAGGQGLHHIHVDHQVELAAAFDQRLERLTRGDAILRRAEARPHELELEVFAHDHVVAAADAEDIHPPRDLGVAQQGGPGHRVVPVLVEAGEREGCAESLVIDAFHHDPAAERVRQEHQRADPVPEVAAGGQAADEGLEAFVECLLAAGRLAGSLGSGAIGLAGRLGGRLRGVRGNGSCRGCRRHSPGDLRGRALSVDYR
jgi:hypothetical protein